MLTVIMANSSMNKTDLDIYYNLSEHITHFPILVIFIIVGIIVSVFNVLSISIILCSKKLDRPHNYPIISVLCGATLQSLFTIPAYALKRMDKDISHRPESWICNLYRFPYFLLGDILRLSLMIVSYDRLIAVKYPYTYRKVITKNVYRIGLCIVWSLVLLVDSIPFFPLNKIPDTDGCNYIPTHIWNIGVIIGFNIVPFIVVVFNYVILWRLAARITVKDNQLYRQMTKIANSSNLGSCENENFKCDHCAEFYEQEFFDYASSIDETNTYKRRESYVLAVEETENASQATAATTSVREKRANPCLKTMKCITFFRLEAKSTQKSESAPTSRTSHCGSSTKKSLKCGISTKNQCLPKTQFSAKGKSSIEGQSSTKSMNSSSLASQSSKTSQFSTPSQCSSARQCSANIDTSQSNSIKIINNLLKRDHSTKSQGSRMSKSSTKSRNSTLKMKSWSGGYLSTGSVGHLTGEVTEKLRVLWEMKATKTSATLLFVYIVCWAPLGTYYFIENICSSWISGIRHEHAYMDQFALKVMSFFSSILLPLVYCWRTKLFRRVAKRYFRQHSERIRRFKKR